MLAEQLTARATRRFVTYLELLRPRSGETSDEIDVRIEVETEDDEAVEEAEAADQDVEPEEEMDAEASGERPGELGLDAAPSTLEDGPGDGPRRRRVVIPDDPTVLSHLLAGILQIELPRRQALLELETTEDRLVALLRVIDREIFLLRRRLRAFIPDARVIGPRRS